MSFNEPYRPKFGFDIRIRPPREEPAQAAAAQRRCEWAGCTFEGKHRAPVSRERINEHRWFCLDHVRAFNHSWNFFDGLDDDEVRAVQTAALTGDRPTWRFGTISSNAGLNLNRMRGLGDTFGLFGWRAPRAEPARGRPLTKRQTRAFEVFDLEHSAPKDDIRRRFKDLVKRFHPDAHGGDRTMEERLREVIDAYQVLRSGGFC